MSEHFVRENILHKYSKSPIIRGAGWQGHRGFEKSRINRKKTSNEVQTQN